jgi:[ribosomal protein S5]-alanine N-acetyltransferase
MNLRLETSRLILKPTLAGDLETLHEILIDPFVRKYLCDDRIFDRQETAEMLAESQRLFDSEKLGLWLIETKNSGEIIGFVGLWYFFAEERPQLAYALLPQATKQGYGTEAATKIIEYCFDCLDYDYLIASTDKPNINSHQLAKRLGMRQIEEKAIDGNPVLFFRIDRDHSNQ